MTGYQRLREEIKALALKQKYLKNQRKTVNIVGPAILSPQQAQMIHEQNRRQLRLLYATQQILKGKDIIDLEPIFKKDLYGRSHKYKLAMYCDYLMRLAEKYTDPIITSHATL